LDLGTELPLIDTDQGQIQQVLINLYANAADAMGKGLIETTTRLEDGRVAVVVTDQGFGTHFFYIIHPTSISRFIFKYVDLEADVVELVDTLDLGSSGLNTHANQTSPQHDELQRFMSI